MKALLFLASIQSLLLAAPTIQIISDPTAEYIIRSATVISPDGTTVCGEAGKKDNEGKVAYLWTKQNGLTIIGDLPGGKITATPQGISSDGNFVVGVSSSSNGTEAFGWTAISGMIGLGDFDGGEFSSSADGVSGDAQTIVGKGVAEGAGSSRRHGDTFIWTRKDRMQPLADLGEFEDTSWASAISTDGTTIIGKGSNASGRSEAFRIYKGKLHGLGCLLEALDFYSEAIAVNGDGSIVVGNSGHGNGQREVFIWTEAKGISRIPDFPKKGRSSAIDVSDDGRVLGTWSDGNGQDFFVWDEKRGVIFIEELVKKIDPPDKETGWFEVSSVKGISADGRFLIGYGRHRVDRLTVADAFLLDFAD